MKISDFQVVCLTAFLLCACEGKRPAPTVLENRPPVRVLSRQTDTSDVRPPLVLVEEEPLSDNIDNLFEDFVYYFAINDELQRSRIRFPLPVTIDGTAITVTSAAWSYDSLFTEVDFYTQLYDREQDMEAENDLEAKDVTLEYYDVAASRLKSYRFCREEAKWMLVSIVESNLETSRNAEFVNFFHHFLADSLYQLAHVAPTISFATVNPIDEFDIIEASIDREQWFSFVSLPSKSVFVNINYGRQYARKPTRKVVSLKGVSNGFSNMLAFRRSGSEWMLMHFEDMSN